jgi:hypothetical protein
VSMLDDAESLSMSARTIISVSGSLDVLNLAQSRFHRHTRLPWVGLSLQAKGGLDGNGETNASQPQENMARNTTVPWSRAARATHEHHKALIATRADNTVSLRCFRKQQSDPKAWKCESGCFSCNVQH